MSTSSGRELVESEELQWGIECEEFDDLKTALLRLTDATATTAADLSGAANITKTSGWLATGVFLAKTRKILQALDIRSLKATRVRSTIIVVFFSCRTILVVHICWEDCCNCI